MTIQKFVAEDHKTADEKMPASFILAIPTSIYGDEDSLDRVNRSALMDVTHDKAIWDIHFKDQYGDQNLYADSVIEGERLPLVIITDRGVIAEFQSRDSDFFKYYLTPGGESVIYQINYIRIS